MKLVKNQDVEIVDGVERPKPRQLKMAFGEKIEPLGFDRFKTCELMAELLHCSNMALLNERGGERYVRERDTERERILAGGTPRLNPEDDGSIGSVEDLSRFNNGQFGSSFASLPGEADMGSRNIADDDGFEDVATSGALNDDVRDDFDEAFDQDSEDITKARENTKSIQDQLNDAFEEFNITDKSTASSSVNKDENKTKEEKPSKVPAEPEEADAKPSPLKRRSLVTAKTTESVDASKPSDIASKEGTEAEAIAENPSKSESSKSNSSEPQAKGTVSAAEKDISHTSAPEKSENTESVDSNQTKDDTETTKSTHVRKASADKPSSETTEPVKAAVRSPSPPVEQPAPLFANRSRAGTGTGTADPIVGSEQTTEPNENDDTIDATAEDGETMQSVLMGADSSMLEPQIQLDLDGKPVVGDLLKIMFVQNKVVPTILVSIQATGFTTAMLTKAYRTSSSGSLGITSYIMLSMMLFSKCLMDRWIEAITGLWRLMFSRQGASQSESSKANARQSVSSQSEECD
jgi:SIT4-associating protein SAP185/190